MKKILALTLVLSMLLLLAACGGQNNANTNSNSTTGGITDSGIAPEDEIVIKASNYKFDQEEYHLTKGVPVKISFENEEGYHGVIIPGLKVQLDAKSNSIVITPDEAGTFEISCSIMCGSGHGNMKAKIIVE